MRSSRFLTLMLALPMAFLLLSCDGNGDNAGPILPQPGGGDGVVSVQVPAGAAFYGFDVVVDYNAAAMTPRTPLETYTAAAGLGLGSQCAPALAGSELRLGCADSDPMTGPGEIAVFGFTYSGDAPTAGDFDVDCTFYDATGSPTALACTGTWID